MTVSGLSVGTVISDLSCCLIKDISLKLDDDTAALSYQLSQRLYYIIELALRDKRGIILIVLSIIFVVLWQREGHQRPRRCEGTQRT